MLFIDPFFLMAFLPIACAAFYWCGRRFGSTPALGVLFATSLIFYAPWGWFDMALLLCSVVLNFMVGAALIAIPDSSPRTRFRLHLLGQCCNFAALIAFKYGLYNAFVQHAGASFLPAALAIPAGISFYTFHQAAFLADAYAREGSVVRFLSGIGSWAGKLRALVRYGAFVTFFPQLVIGPIVYLHEFQPQVDNRKFGRLRQAGFNAGLALITIGLLKKVLLADHLGPNADNVFQAAEAGRTIGAGNAWVGILSYYAQLYFDFSGYSDIALGLGRLFGIRYPINFDSPLKSLGITDFYRRWHMTLTRVISRFMFTPLSLSGGRLAMRWSLQGLPLRALTLWLPLLVNFEVIALWHGAAATFVVFGVIHGIWYLLETEVRATRRWKDWRKRTPDWLRVSLERALFVVPMSLTFALFRASSLGGAIRVYRQLLHWTPDAEGGPLLHEHWQLYLLMAFGTIYLLPNSVNLLKRYRAGIRTYVNPQFGPRVLQLIWRADWRWALATGAGFVVVFYFVTHQAPFLYQGF